MVAKRTLLFALCVQLAASCAAPKRENPYESAERVEPTQARWSGRVLERLNAGSYVYLRIEREGAEATWVVTAEALASDAERVSVHVLRRVDHFESKRLGRAFAPLFFGIVRKDHS